MNIYDIPTPALLVDADLLRSNIAEMAGHMKARGKRLRPHFKAHKCVQVARMQIDSGAAGICAATESEARALIDGGIPEILLTSPIADPAKARRLAELRESLTVVVDHPDQVSLFEATRAPMNVMVDLDVGDHRTGVPPGAPALALTRRLLQSGRLRFAGLQGYSVRASHTETAERVRVSAEALRAVEETRALLESDGIATPLTTGASTATYAIDAAGRALDEIQAGSYVYMDLAYRRLGEIPFHNAATVVATVISVSHSDRVTVDAGFKAFSTDRPFGPEPLARADLRYAWGGDEFGVVTGDNLPGLGERVRFVPPHCDPTANLYDRVYLHQGEEVVEVWPVQRTR